MTGGRLPRYTSQATRRAANKLENKTKSPEARKAQTNRRFLRKKALDNHYDQDVEAP